MRLVNADALKEALHNFFDGKVIDEPTYILRDVFCYIDNAQTIEEKSYAMGFQDGLEDGLQDIRPQGKWIPVSERLPDLWAVVLVTDESGNVFEYERRPLDENGNEYNEWCFLGRKIIAWQPLPEPYEKGGAE